jgi:hypothetical protein
MIVIGLLWLVIVLTLLYYVSTRAQARKVYYCTTCKTVIPDGSPHCLKWSRVPCVFASLFVLAMTIVATRSASAQTNPCPSQGTNAAPTNLRVDIADGTTGKLFVSWQPPGTGSFTYNVCRSTDNSTWQLVTYCSGTAPTYNTSRGMPDNRLACRDDGGVLANTSTPLNPGTPYYYEVQACDSSGSNCGQFISTAGVNQNYNTPISCNCTPTPTMFSSMMPSMQNLTATFVTGVATSAVIGSMYAYPFPCPIGITCAGSANDVKEYYGYHNTGYYYGYPQTSTTQIPNRAALLVQLPGSGSFCGDSVLQKTARNLGFDTICVNYDNKNEQEVICSPSAQGNFQDPTDVANCFSAISQAKLDWTSYLPNNKNINCTSALNAYCGIDSQNVQFNKTGTNYYVASPYDSVKYRISTMLYWLWCNGTDRETATITTYWETYLLNSGVPITAGTACPDQTYSMAYTPNWSSIILAGWSQGGNMATFADYIYPVQRVVNLSAPLPATNVMVNGVTQPVAASYFADLPQPANFQSIYGLVSANDDVKGVNGTIHYSPPYSYSMAYSVLQTVWGVMGFNAANNDEEVELNCDVSSVSYSGYCINNSLPPLDCTSATRSHNFVNWGLAIDYLNPNGPKNGHADTLYPWNEEIYEYMLIDYTTSQLTAATPAFNPLPGTYSSAQSVTLSDTTIGAAIHCTTDGSTPTAGSPVCTTLQVSTTTTIQAIAVANGYNNSAVASGTYKIRRNRH